MRAMARAVFSSCCTFVEFEGKPGGVAEAFCYPGIDALYEGFDDGFPAGMVVRELFAHIAAVGEEAGSDVSFQFVGAEYFCEGARGLAAPEFELKESVPGGAITLCKEEVMLVAGIDVVHAPTIPQHFYALVQAGDGKAVGLCLAHGDVQAAGREQQG